jgi:TRAP-type transport system periplasmic protein
MKKMVEDQLKVKILGPDLLRHAPGGPEAEEEDQHAGRHGRHQAAHAARRRLAVAGPLAGRQPDADGLCRDLHRLQTGAIDGQDNPLPNVQNMKFYEVMSQIVLTSHLVGFDLLTINLKTWQAMSPAQQAPSRPPPTRPSPGARPSTSKREPRWPTASRSRASTSTRPTSTRSASTRRRSTWRPTRPRTGRRMLDKINAMK